MSFRFKLSLSSKALALTFFLVLTPISLSFAACSISAQDGADQYSRMRPKPKMLFDKWAMNQNSVDGKKSTPFERFVNLPISQRSTFAALTNALLYSKLTDPSSGQLLGFAIDLIDEIETIAGQEEGRRSDEQFRLYVKLKDGAVKKLDVSPEFIHDKDNTIFHKGYPTNYRQSGNAPTLQFSITRDGSHADIDVDYRSSRFPAALFDGHLTTGNSDVRATGNYLTHLKRWSGLIDWWDDIFPVSTTELDKAKTQTPSDPVNISGDFSEAELGSTIDSFFKSWLVDRDVNRAMTYLQSNLTFCSDLEESPDRQILASRYKVLFFGMLQAANKELKKPKSLAEAIRSVPAIDPLIPAVENNPQKDLYTLAVITDGDYDHFVCTIKKSNSVNKNHLGTTGRHYVTKFRFALASGNGGILRLMWTKETGSWKIESFDAVTA